MVESDQQREQRLLDELKGRNIAHYSVMLAAILTARIDANRAIFLFSSTAIGLLISIANKLQSMSICIKLLYVGALVAFFVAVCSTLFVYTRHAEAIESYIRGEGKEKAMDFKMKTWKHINYVSFAIGLALALFFTIAGLFVSN